MKIQAAVLLAVILAFSFAAAAFAENESIDPAMQAVFPDWKGYTDHEQYVQLYRVSWTGDGLCTDL